MLTDEKAMLDLAIAPVGRMVEARVWFSVAGK